MIVNSRNNPQRVCKKASLLVALRFESHSPSDVTASHALALRFFTRSARWLLARCKPDVRLPGNTKNQLRRRPSKVKLATTERSVHLGRYVRDLVTGLRLPTCERGRMELTTVTRSPFVYKKTREQFGLRSMRIAASLSVRQAKMSHMVSGVCRLRFPGEFTLISR